MSQSRQAVRKAFEDIWAEKAVAAWLLFPASLLYQMGWVAYASLYQYGIKRARIPALPTICIGNVTAGGSGKTPFTLEIARNLNARGILPVLSTSGYKSQHYRGAALAPAGPLETEIWGDEASMLRFLDPELPLIVGHDRVEAAKIAARQYPDRVLLMDDGFQHLRLKPDYCIVIDPEPENDFCFPAGPYREPPWYGKARADDVLIYGRDLIAQPLEVMEEGICLENKQSVNVLCALGQPQRFLESVRLAGFTIKDQKLLADHDPMTDPNLLKGFNPRFPLIVTAKDYVKLREHQSLEPFRIAIAHYRVTPRDEERFYATIINRINELRKEKTGQ